MQGIHRKIEKAIDRLNRAFGKSYPSIGAHYYADVRGDGTSRPRVYVCINANGGLSDGGSLLNRKTYAETLRAIELETRLKESGA